MDPKLIAAGQDLPRDQEEALKNYYKKRWPEAHRLITGQAPPAYSAEAAALWLGLKVGFALGRLHPKLIERELQP